MAMPANAGCRTVSLDDVAHALQHGLLDARIEQIVIRREAAASSVGFQPRSPVAANPFQAGRLRVTRSSQRFERGERRRKVDGRQKRDAFAVEDAKHEFGAVDVEWRLCR